MMSALSRPLRLFFLLLFAILAPFVLDSIYVLAMHGYALSPHALHQAWLFMIMLSPVPFIAAMPIGRVTRGVLAILFVVALFFTATDIGFGLCVLFGWQEGEEAGYSPVRAAFFVTFAICLGIAVLSWALIRWLGALKRRNI